jgi:hypothetical protein
MVRDPSGATMVLSLWNFVRLIGIMIGAAMVSSRMAKKR